jgi:peptidoglycan L-alanyl-D-glutamate endopeptidase CwlK
MRKFIFSLRSKNNLRGVHPDLQRVVARALEITPVDFMIVQGLRSFAEQKKLMIAGATKTLKSRHLTGHAVDVGAIVGGKYRADWPLYEKIAVAMKQAAKELGVDIVWGGDWAGFRDGPHFELYREKYPDDKLIS